MSASAGPVLAPSAVRPTITIDYTALTGSGLLLQKVEGTIDLGAQAVYDERSGTFGLNTPVSVAGVFQIDNIAVGTNPDPFVEYSFGVKNFTSSPLSLLFSFVSPYIAGPYSTLQSSHSSTVTDGAVTNGSVSVSPNLGALIHRPEIDGAAAPGAFGPGCSPGGGAGFSTACDPLANGLFPVVTLASGNFGVDVGFTLSANDLYSTSGRVELSNVPEPGTWALLCAGLVGLFGIARRRMR